MSAGARDDDDGPAPQVGPDAEGEAREDAVDEDVDGEEDPYFEDDGQLDVADDAPDNEDASIPGTAPRGTLTGQVLRGTWVLDKPFAAKDQGGMGDLYAAHHLHLGTRHAVKLVRAGLGLRNAHERLRQEARITARLVGKSDYIVPVQDLNEHEGQPYYVMPELQGETLKARLKGSGGLSFELASDLLGKILRGVAVAHAEGIIHRDLKPANIFLETRDDGIHPRIIDFGIAKALGEASTTVTDEQAAWGTTLYKAPEYYGEVAPAIQPGVDVFSLGMIGYEMIVGRHPWTNLTAHDVIAKYRAGPPLLQPLQDTKEAQGCGVPLSFCRVINRALDPDPAVRFATAADMLRALERTRIFDPRGLTGRRLGSHYLVGEVLGSGGFGVVYRATDERPGRGAVAIKIAAPPPELTDDQVQEMYARFAAECDALRRAGHHRNVVAFLDKDREHGHPYTVMPFIDGEDLGAYARRVWKLADGWRSLVAVLEQIAEALDFVHEHGVVHRDVKPSNILVERTTGRAVLVDFGIARVDDGWLTKTGQAPGTPGFAAPEQIGGPHVGAVPASDQWALAAVVYYLLSGMRPGEAHAGQNLKTEDLMTATARGEVVDLAVASPDRPAPLAAAVMRALAHDPARRFSSCRAFMTAIREASADSRVLPTAAPAEGPTPVERPRGRDVEPTARVTGARPARVAVPLVFLVAAAAAGVWMVQRDRGNRGPAVPAAALTTKHDELAVPTDATPPATSPPDASAVQRVQVAVVAHVGGKERDGVILRVDGDETRTPATLERAVGDELVIEVIDERYRRTSVHCMVDAAGKRCGVVLRRRRSSEPDPEPVRRELVGIPGQE